MTAFVSNNHSIFSLDRTVAFPNLCCIANISGSPPSEKKNLLDQSYIVRFGFRRNARSKFSLDRTIAFPKLLDSQLFLVSSSYLPPNIFDSDTSTTLLQFGGAGLANVARSRQANRLDNFVFFGLKFVSTTWYFRQDFFCFLARARVSGLTWFA